MFFCSTSFFFSNVDALRGDQGRKLTQVGPNLAKVGPILAPSWLILAPLGPILAPSWPNLASKLGVPGKSLEVPRLTPGGLDWLLGPKTLQEPIFGPSLPQVGPNMAPTWPNLAPTWNQDGPQDPQLGAKMAPKTSN